MSNVNETQFGFKFGPLRVERMAYDDKLGWVIDVRPLDSYKPRVIVRVSPKGKNWTVTVNGCDVVNEDYLG